MAVIRQEAHLVADVPDHLLEILARFTRNLRESTAVDQRSGVSARFAIAGAETIAASALRRATVLGEDEAVARVVDLETAVDVLGGKIEFETGEEGREAEILTHLLRTATAETVREHFRGLDFALLVEAIEDGATGHHRRAGLGPRRPRRAAGARRVRALRRGLRPALGAGQRRRAGRRDRARPRGPVPRPQDRQGHRRSETVYGSYGLTPARSQPVRRRRPARAAGRHRRGARRHRRGRHGRLQPGAGDAGVPAARRPGPATGSTTWPGGWRSGGATCCSGTTSTARSRRCASCWTAPCSRSASSSPATR